MKASAPFTYSQQIKNGKYQVVFSFKNDNGKRKLKWVSTRLPENCSQKALKAKVSEIVKNFTVEFNTGEITKVKADKIDKASISEALLKNLSLGNTAEYEFTAFMNYWLLTVKPTLAYNTFISYNRVVGMITKYFDEKYPHVLLNEVTGLMIQQYYNDMFSSGLTANTIKHRHANLHKAFKYAMKMDLVNSNPTDKADLPKMNKFTATFYNKDELEGLFKVIKDDRMELVVYIAAYYGLRRSEICGLKWDCIDFDKKTITIRRKVVNDFGDGKEKIICENTLKTKASQRTLPLIPEIEKRLKERYFLEQHYAHLLKGDFNREYEGFVCRDNLGKLITPDFISTHFRYIIKKYGLKKIRFHDLRHSCASLLLANGVPMKAIQEWLGHSTFHVTADFYSHLDYNSKISSAETIARVLGRTEYENEGKPNKSA